MTMMVVMVLGLPNFVTCLTLGRLASWDLAGSGGRRSAHFRRDAHRKSLNHLRRSALDQSRVI